MNIEHSTTALTGMFYMRMGEQNYLEMPPFTSFVVIAARHFSRIPYSLVIFCDNHWLKRIPSKIILMSYYIYESFANKH